MDDSPLSQISEENAPPSQEELTQAEYRDLENEKEKADGRRKYGKLIAWFAGIWLAFDMLMIVLSGCGCIDLSDSVMIALITTTTASVLGLFIIVAKFFFSD